MWTIAAVNKKIDGPLGSYNGLTDVHLAHFFSRPHQQSHLKAAKLITEDGTIIPEQKVKIATLEYEKKKKMYDILANTVIQNAAHKESSWNKKLSNCLEDILKMENVERIKTGSKKKNRNAFHGSFKSSSVPATFQSYDLCKWLSDKINEKNILSTPKSAPTTNRKSFKNHTSNIHSSISKLKRCFSAKEASPYVFPLLMCNTHTFNPQKGVLQTVKPHKKKKKKKWKKNAINVEPNNPSSADTSSTKITKLSFPDQNFNIDQCKVTLYYYGHSPLAKSQTGIVEEITIRQQHCGGTPVIIYKGHISPNESVAFICLDHEGFTFSITLFLDGIRYLKLSSCCIFRYSPGRRLGGSSGCFAIRNIEGGKPCLRCQYRQIETGTNLYQRFDIVTLEDTRSMKAEEFVAEASNFNRLDFVEVVENDNLIRNNGNENHTEDDVASSVASEVVHSASEEIEETTDIFNDNQDVILSNDVTENTNEIEDKNASVEENLNDESSYDSESSVKSIAESIKNVVKTEEFQSKPYQSETSDDDDDGVQEHIVIASVHGSPS
ncbi:glutamate-rich protein 3-like isoform X2 [Argiope bruennichi]|uniref:Glutamate-rich protein 3 like protein n=1 Tax=Argiope bruennichi TaxID=94029 RepID=A0A8T0F259_ARGBR|nr:glutamate-rich protein 3-like isoform X2 [Argiope bruennichi]XP_055928288.1 glutamate-rich protein 3-like isoform X2 [Argiope bruennichi]KAF8784552.1 Glutamate-rich protein 3 like protein [Argiope bruennichi]